MRPDFAYPFFLLDYSTYGSAGIATFSLDAIGAAVCRDVLVFLGHHLRCSCCVKARGIRCTQQLRR